VTDTGNKPLSGRVGQIQRQVRRFSWILTDILGEALAGNTEDNTEPGTLGDILGRALQSVRTPDGTPEGSLGDILGAALRTATEQPSAVLVTGAKQEPPATQNSGETANASATGNNGKTVGGPTSIDQRLAKLRGTKPATAIPGRCSTRT
jgi:hypothetical protein